MIEPARMRAPAPMQASPDTPGRPGGYPSNTPGSTIDPAPSRTSAAPGRSHFNGCASRSHGRLDGHEGPDDADAEARVRQRRGPGSNRRDEFQALVLQRLARLHLRADDVAVADEQLELAERFGDRLADRYAALEDAHALHVVQVVEDDAAAAADDDDLAHLVRVGPADVDVADHAVAVAERGERDVVAVGAQHARADGRGPLRLRLQQIVEDRDVVGGQIPHRVHVVTD